tara:strand:+ start:1175 stop:1822 length:648 start_codon:yes stop_codon:yes gene_type:complete
VTYLQIVNNILKRLRERTVSTVNETDYSSLIALFVNDAKELVENSWDWSALRTSLTVNTTADVFNYELNGSQNRLSVLDVVNDTSDFFMSYRTAHEFNTYFLSASPQRGIPTVYSYNGISSDGDTQVDLYPIPDGVYNLRFNIVQRTADLVNDSDTITVPSRPVETLAYALAVEERGEDGGLSPASAIALADKTLSDAVAFDSAKHEEETEWMVR